MFNWNLFNFIYYNARTKRKLKKNINYLVSISFRSYSSVSTSFFNAYLLVRTFVERFSWYVIRTIWRSRPFRATYRPLHLVLQLALSSTKKILDKNFFNRSLLFRCVAHMSREKQKSAGFIEYKYNLFITVLLARAMFELAIQVDGTDSRFHSENG